MSENPQENVSEVEIIKERSNYLRGTIAEGLQDPLTGSVSESDTKLTKFHGMYQQDDRDLRSERRKQKLEPLYSFMVRVRVPGGVCTPSQWLVLDGLAHTHASGTLKLTTRQSFQFHGVLKRNLKSTIQGINSALMHTLACCGDVSRNVMGGVNPNASPVHAEVYEWTQKFSAYFTPKTNAYHEIWLDGEKVESSQEEQEPIYGKTYLPRKFKIATVIPPRNDVDVYSQDTGLIAIVEDGKLMGFNIVVGGGMGMTHGNEKTYPRLASLIGFVGLDHVLQTVEEIVKIQRDFGDRSDRHHARLKYTIDDRGVDWFVDELETRLGRKLEAAKPFSFESNGDQYGWGKGVDGKWHITLYIQNGRVIDTEDYPLMTGLREIAKVHKGDYRLTGNQNLLIGGIADEDKAEIEALLKQYKLADSHHQTGLRLNAMACVAFPTCGLAMAESERYLPSLLDKLDVIMKDAGLEDDPIVIRMTGCPNGCSRPYLGEIAFVGKAPGKYNLYLGASFVGDRLNKLYKENIGEEDILAELDPLIHRYADEREEGESFGDYVIRTGVVKATSEGKDFHA